MATSELGRASTRRGIRKRDSTATVERERLFAGLRHAQRALLAAASREELFAAVCRVLVEQAGFRAASVAWSAADSGLLTPVAVWGVDGDDDGLLADPARDPCAAAFRSGRPCVRADRGGAAFPLRCAGLVGGVLRVALARGRALDGAAAGLLEEAAADISLALDRLARDDRRRRAEAVLRDEKQFADIFIESMPGILYFYDAQGRFLRWNRNFEVASGYSGEEVARMHPHDFFAGEGRARVAARIAEVFAHGEATVEADFIAKDGTATPYFFTGKRVEYAGQSCLVGVGLDITDRRRAEARLAESERQYRELVEHANSIILRWSADGRIVFLNEFGQRFFGYAADEIIGRHVVGTIVPPTESGGRDLRHLIDDIGADPGAFEQNVNENIRRDGTRIWVAWTNRIVRDAGGRVVEILSIGHDITERRRAAEALREAELRFHTLFEQTPVGVVVLDADSGAIVECNAQAARQLGYTPRELAALRLSDLAVDAAPTGALLERLRREGGLELETQQRTRDGEVRDVFVSARLLELTGRTVCHCVFLDVTDRTRAEARIRESEAHLVEAQRIAKMGSWELDLRRGRLRWSDQIHEIFALPRTVSDSTYDAFLALVHPADRARVQAAQEAALAGQERLDIEHRIVLRDGSEKVVHELADLKRDAQGVPIALAGTVHDITDRVRVRVEREKRQRAEEADRIKSAFLATMSHELRTPLNSIIGFTGILLQGLAGPLNAEQSKQLGMVRGSARHLLELINDVLDISKIEAGQLEVRAEAFDLPAAIERVAASVRPLAERKALALTTAVAPALGTMVSDRRRVEQILINLLNNAIKFTERGGVALTVEAATMPDAAAAVRLCVADTGIGIAPDELSSLFQPFRQLDSGLTRQHDGTGLGLAICRRLAELLGGEITASSEPGKGSKFSVLLPLRRAG